MLFESFRLNSDTFEQWDPIHYPDNRYNVAPKLMAEANRPDGFKVLSLGYAEGPPDQMSPLTLVGQSTVGLDSLMEDIQVTQDLQGFRHYLTDAAVSLVNDFVFTQRLARRSRPALVDQHVQRPLRVAGGGADAAGRHPAGGGRWRPDHRALGRRDGQDRRALRALRAVDAVRFRRRSEADEEPAHSR